MPSRWRVWHSSSKSSISVPAKNLKRFVGGLTSRVSNSPERACSSAKSLFPGHRLHHLGGARSIPQWSVGLVAQTASCHVFLRYSNLSSVVIFLPRRLCWLIPPAAEALGRVHGVVGRRRGRIVAEEMKESTTFFTIRALLPVVDSFGFAEGMSFRG